MRAGNGTAWPIGEQLVSDDAAVGVVAANDTPSITCGSRKLPSGHASIGFVMDRSVLRPSVRTLSRAASLWRPRLRNWWPVRTSELVNVFSGPAVRNECCMRLCVELRSVFGPKGDRRHKAWTTSPTSDMVSPDTLCIAGRREHSELAGVEEREVGC